MKTKSNGLGINPVHITAALGLAGVVGAMQLIAPSKANAQVPPPAEVPIPLAALNTVQVPLPADLDVYIKDRAAAIRLGKALFWDMQVGSDKTACASCHYQAGADGRDRNQLNPGPDGRFDTTHSNNFQLKLDTHFPLTKFQDALDVNSPKIRSRNDIVGSQGVFKTDFVGLTNGSFGVGSFGAEDAGITRPDAVFTRSGVNTRQVTGRNSPSVINAVFNHRNFWDGRAHNEFNGVNPFGDSDVNARVYETDPVTGQAVAVQVRILDASLASQAVGPVNSDVEMAHGGRNFPIVAKKLLGVKPLALQKVAADDSVLGAVANPTKGLDTTYDAMIKAAIQDKWWNGSNRFNVAAGGRVVPATAGQFSHMEGNFSLIFGLAVMMYESTLVSDQTPYDRYLNGDATALSASAIRGITVLETQGCTNCHTGATLTNAATPIALLDAAGAGLNILSEVMPMQDLLPSAYDVGYYNIGVRPTAEDIGIGANDPFGNPLSFSRGLQVGFITEDNRPAGQEVTATTRLAINGAFKTPGLRNVALTAPYMHNGGAATLSQVINVYHRGGDFGRENMPDTSPDVALAGGMTIFQKRDLLQLMLEMTDARVERRSAPFDHPELIIPNGHTIRTGTNSTLINRGNGTAQDNLLVIPATGRNGGAPLRRFLGNTETRFF
ncbi:MAG: cytochrome-c peroxidase [Armatimonadaceae bacterium]